MHQPPPATAAVCADDVLTEAVLQVVRDRVGVDFSQYRPATMQRRLRNRMLAVGAATLHEYLQRLWHEADEADALAERLAIKVSSFYRNAATFDLLRHVVVPALRVRGVATSAPLRVWCAGCGRGEEAYTLAMLLDEAGIEGQVEATDIDRGALDAARAAHFPPTSVIALPEALAARYLEPVASGRAANVRVVDRVRERVTFTRHDVTGAPPAHTFDLVSCRNVLIYLQRPLQARTMANLRGALGLEGVLVLGEAEWPTPDIEASLEVIARQARVFKAKPVSRGQGA